MTDGDSGELAPPDVTQACIDLVNRYAYLMDDGPAVDGIGLFGPEPSIDHHTGETFAGREQLVALFAAKDAGSRVTRHVTSNIVITLVDDDSATGAAVFTLYEGRCDDPAANGPLPLEGPSMIGTYADSFVRTDAGWRFSERKITALFQRS